MVWCYLLVLLSLIGPLLPASLAQVDVAARSKSFLEPPRRSTVSKSVPSTEDKIASEGDMEEEQQREIGADTGELNPPDSDGKIVAFPSSSLISCPPFSLLPVNPTSPPSNRKGSQVGEK